MHWDSSTALPIVHRLWLYSILFTTGILTEEPTAIIGGVWAHVGHIRLLTAGFSVSAGTWSADIVLYYIGRWRGHWARKRFPSVRRVLLRTFKLVRRHPWRASVLTRWAFGLRLPLPIACGAAQLPIVIYLLGSAIGALTWGYTFTLLGWGFAKTTYLVLGHVKRYENYLILVILLASLIALIVMRRRHVEDASVEVLAAGDPDLPPRISE